METLGVAVAAPLVEGVAVPGVEPAEAEEEDLCGRGTLTEAVREVAVCESDGGVLPVW